MQDRTDHNKIAEQFSRRFDETYVEARVGEISAFEARAAGRAPPRKSKLNPQTQPKGEPDMPAAERATDTMMTMSGSIPQAIVVAPSEPPTPLSIVHAALMSGNVEMYRQAIELAKDMDAITARKAFDRAMAEAKAKIPVIRKNRTVGFDSRKPGAARTDYDHEDMAEIARTVSPILGEHGLSYRYRVSSKINEPVTVTCVISHRDGHFEETTLTAARDDSGNKNTLQQVGSTITYLQRYTLKAALGLAAGRDDDGQAAGDKPVETPPLPGTISADQAAEIRKLLEARGIAHRAFLQFIRLPSIEHIGAEHFDKAVAKIKSLGVHA